MGFPNLPMTSLLPLCASDYSHPKVLSAYVATHLVSRDGLSRTGSAPAPAAMHIGYNRLHAPSNNKRLLATLFCYFFMIAQAKQIQPVRSGASGSGSGSTAAQRQRPGAKGRHRPRPA